MMHISCEFLSISEVFIDISFELFNTYYLKAIFFFL